MELIAGRFYKVKKTITMTLNAHNKSIESPGGFLYVMGTKGGNVVFCITKTPDEKEAAEAEPFSVKASDFEKIIEQ